MPQLRDFYAYNKTAGFVPTFVNANATENFPCVLISLDGVAAGAGYLQIHDLLAASSLSSGVTVPLKSYRVAAAGALPSIFGVLGGITLTNGLVIAFSSTEEVYTALATRIDVVGQIDEYELSNIIGSTIVGDESSGVDALIVWANGATTQGLHQLRRAVITNSNGATSYLMLFAHSPSNGDIPIEQWALADAARLIQNFGTSGIVPFAKTAANVLRDGCYLQGSSTTGTLTKTVATSWKIKAWWI